MEVLIKTLFLQSWILLAAVTCANAFIMKFKAKKHILANPGLAYGYEKMFKAVLIYGNLPWLVIGFGNLTGLTKSTFDYFAPRQLNPIVLIFHFLIIVFWILSVRWIYFKNGAKFLELHPGLFRQDPTAQQIKLLFPLMLLGGIFGMVLMWVVNPTIIFPL